MSAIICIFTYLLCVLLLAAVLSWTAPADLEDER